MREAGHGEHGALVEVAREGVGVERGGHEDDAEVREQRQQPLEHHQHEVCVAIPLVDLVDDDVRDTVQLLPHLGRRLGAELGRCHRPREGGTI